LKLSRNKLTRKSYWLQSSATEHSSTCHYISLHNLLIVLVHIANKMGLDCKQIDTCIVIIERFSRRVKEPQNLTGFFGAHHEPGKRQGGKKWKYNLSANNLQ
jgi:hypothetical protein